MTRTWRLTPRAERSLVDIALWTIETFGSSQAAIYERELIDRCTAIAEGRAHSRDCAVILPEAARTGLRYARAAEHFVVFVELADEVVIVDILHSRSDLPVRIAALSRMRGG